MRWDDDDYFEETGPEEPEDSKLVDPNDRGDKLGPPIIKARADGIL